MESMDYWGSLYMSYRIHWWRRFCYDGEQDSWVRFHVYWYGKCGKELWYFFYCRACRQENGWLRGTYINADGNFLTDSDYDSGSDDSGSDSGSDRRARLDMETLLL